MSNTEEMIARLNRVIAELKEIKRIMGYVLGIFLYVILTHAKYPEMTDTLSATEKDRTELTHEQPGGGYPYV